MPAHHTLCAVAYQPKRAGDKAGQRDAQSVGAPRAPSTRHRSHRNQGEHDAIEGCRQSIVRFSQQYAPHLATGISRQMRPEELRQVTFTRLEYRLMLLLCELIE